MSTRHFLAHLSPWIWLKRLRRPSNISYATTGPVNVLILYGDSLLAWGTNVCSNNPDGRHAHIPKQIKGHFCYRANLFHSDIRIINLYLIYLIHI